MTEAQKKRRDELGEERAKVYAREFGGFPRGTSLIAVNGHTRGWNEAWEAAIKDAQVLVEALETLGSTNFIEGECTVAPYQGRNCSQIVEEALRQWREGRSG